MREYAILIALILAVLAAGMLAGFYLGGGVRKTEYVTFPAETIVLRKIDTIEVTEIVRYPRYITVNDTVTVSVSDSAIKRFENSINNVDSLLKDLGSDGVEWIISDNFVSDKKDSIFMEFSMTEKQFKPPRVIIAERIAAATVQGYDVPMLGLGIGAATPFYDDKNFRLAAGLVTGAAIGIWVAR